MPGLVPRFILHQYRRRVFEGNLTGSVFLFDISGFTPLTERLSRRGHQGAEILSEILNKLFCRRLMSRIRASGGFISGFAGDSFTVISPGTSMDMALSLGSDLMSILSDSGNSPGIRDVTELSFKAGIATGRLEWGIAGSNMKTWYFSGEAMRAACRAASAACPKGIVTTRCVGSGESRGSFPDMLSVRSSTTAERSFFPELLIHGERFGEFRRVFPVFVSPLPSLCADSRYLAALVEGLMEETSRAGGYFEGVHLDEMGPYILVLFGAPWSFENDGTRSIIFARKILSRFEGKLRAGISAGTVYAGIIGFQRRNTYTVIGNHVNTAARIMRNSCEPGVFVSEEVLKRVHGNRESLETFSLPLRGQSGITRVTKLEEGFLETSVGSFTGKLIGREEEQEELLNEASPILDGRFAGCAIVAGRAGIGKSHLVSSVAGRMAELGCRRINLQCSDISDLGFEPFLPLLREMFGQEEGAGTRGNRAAFKRNWISLMERLINKLGDPTPVEELERTVSMLQALLGIEDEDSLYRRLEARGRHENTLLALRVLLYSLAMLDPLVLVMEDFQWIDSASAEILEMLSRSPDSLPLFVMLTCRHSDDGSIPSLSLRSEVLKVIHLEPLSETMVPVFIEAVLGAPPEQELRSFVSLRTSCIPLYIDQYIRYLMETESIRLKDGFWTLMVRPGSIPHGISDILQARIDRMSAGLRALVQTASVLGYEFNTRVLGRMHGKEGIIPLLESGRKLGIWSALSSIVFVFQHDLLRDTAYTMQLLSKLRSTHERAAAVIEELYPAAESFFPDLARHFEKAGNIEKASSYLRKAAAVSEANYSLREALGYYEKLLGVTGRPGDDRRGERVGIMLSIISVLNRMNLWDRGIEMCEEAETLAGTMGDETALGRVLTLKSWLKLRKGAPEEAEELAARAESLLEGSGDVEEYVKALGYRAATHFNRSSFGKAEELFLRKLDMLEMVDLPVERIKCLANLGCVYKDKADSIRSEDFFNRAAAMAEGMKRLDTLYTILGNRGTLYRNMGDHRKAMIDFSRGIEIARKIGDRRGLSGLLGGLALLRYDTGMFPEALELYLKQLEITTDLDYAFGMAEAHGYMAACLEAMERFDEAEQHYDDCIRISRTIQLRYYTGIFLVLKAAMLFDLGRLFQADEANREGLDICRSIGLREMMTSAALMDAMLRIEETNDPEVIRLNLRRMESLRDSSEDPGERILCSFRIWKTTCRLPESLKSEYDPESRRREALDLVREACGVTSSMEHVRMIEELEAAGT
ncbi:MAG: AAA family ATPase [Candidatus Fermentibacteraceae bacterium]|nr:AAA family ATPase [Candidatus Fermentibacteraceae bacterium]MBN2607496.1 AAA family ATPase [Candidatus Fermentibacteraceae bacterium]